MRPPASLHPPGPTPALVHAAVARVLRKLDGKRRAGAGPASPRGRAPLFFTHLAFSSKSALLGEEVELHADLNRAPDGEAVTLLVFQKTGDARREVTSVAGSVAGTKATASWKVELAEEEPEEDAGTAEGAGPDEHPDALRWLDPPDPTWTTFAFEAVAGKVRGDSEDHPTGRLALGERLQAEVLDAEGKPLAGCRARVTLPDGSTKIAEVAGDGRISLQPVPPGLCVLDLERRDRAAMKVPTTPDPACWISVRIPQVFEEPDPLPFEVLGAS